MSVGVVCQFESRDNHGPSFAIHPHGQYLGPVVYPDLETDDLGELNPPYHATNPYRPACSLPHPAFRML